MSSVSSVKYVRETSSECSSVSCIRQLKSQPREALQVNKRKFAALQAPTTSKLPTTNRRDFVAKRDCIAAMAPTHTVVNPASISATTNSTAQYASSGCLHDPVVDIKQKVKEYLEDNLSEISDRLTKGGRRIDMKQLHEALGLGDNGEVIASNAKDDDLNASLQGFAFGPQKRRKGEVCRPLRLNPKSCLKPSVDTSNTAGNCCRGSEGMAFPQAEGNGNDYDAKCGESVCSDEERWGISVRTTEAANGANEKMKGTARASAGTDSFAGSNGEESSEWDCDGDEEYSEDSEYGGNNRQKQTKRIPKDAEPQAVIAKNFNRMSREALLNFLNTASIKQLCTLKTIGLTRAAIILERRKSLGPFNSLEELREAPLDKQFSIDRLMKENTLLEHAMEEYIYTQ